MYPVSSTLLAAIRQSHTATARAEVIRNNVIISSIPILKGTITDDSGALIRRRVTLELAPTSDVLAMLGQTAPANGGLWPLGNEIKVYSGIVLPNGTTEEIPQGVFRISRPKLADDSSLDVSVDGYDRSRSVSRSRFTQPYSISAGTNYATAIKNLILNRVPSLAAITFNFMTTSYTTPNLVFTSDDDPWKACQDMAKSMGAELFFDGNGDCALRPEPDARNTPPAFEYVEGEDCTLLGVSRELDDEQAYNGVIVTSENTDLTTPIRAEAWDTNPSSATYYDPANPMASLYGPVPYFITSRFITTQAQADDAAAANLSRVTGVMETVDFDAVNNPAHQSGDVIYIKRQNIGISGAQLLDSITIGLGDDTSMRANTRKQRAS